jgi:hypothetical protein
VLTLVNILAKLLMAAGGIGVLLAVLAAIFRADGSGQDSWWFVLLALAWGGASLWIGMRIVPSRDLLVVETVVMLLLYVPILVLAARLFAR